LVLKFGVIETKSSDLIDNSLLYLSKYFDAECSLLYYQNRYYDNTQGKWLSREPIMVVCRIFCKKGGSWHMGKC